MVSFYIVDEIERSGGRFLQRGHRCWIPISRDDARLKVAQAFQYQRRKANQVQDVNTAVVPPPFLRQNHYIPGFRTQTSEAGTQERCLGGSQSDRSGALVNSLYSCNDDVPPFVTSLSFATESNNVPLAQATGNATETRNGKRSSESTKRALKYRRVKTLSSQSQRNIGTSFDVMPSYRSDDDSMKYGRPITMNKGKSDPNERQEAKSCQNSTATDTRQFQTAFRPARGVHDTEFFDQSPSSQDMEGNRSVAVQGKAEGTLDSSGVHSIGISSDDEQQSLVSVLANMNADTWPENEDSASKFQKYR